MTIVKGKHPRPPIALMMLHHRKHRIPRTTAHFQHAKFLVVTEICWAREEFGKFQTKPVTIFEEACFVCRVELVPHFTCICVEVGLIELMVRGRDEREGER